MRGVNWGATLQLSLYRVVAAGVVWAILLPFLVGSEGWTPMVLLMGPMAMALGVGIGLVAIALDKMGVPFAGFGALAAFPAVIADPILWAVQRSRPETLPIDLFGFVNPPIMVVYAN